MIGLAVLLACWAARAQSWQTDQSAQMRQAQFDCSLSGAQPGSSSYSNCVLDRLTGHDPLLDPGFDPAAEKERHADCLLDAFDPSECD